jgi:hypothetical protein
MPGFEKPPAFNLIPEGHYDAEIIKAESTYSQFEGKALQIELTLRIQEGDSARIKKLWLDCEGERGWLLRALCEGCGATDAYNDPEATSESIAASLMNRSVPITVKHKTAKNSEREYEQIGWDFPKKPKDKKADAGLSFNARPKVLSDDEIPF